MPNGLDTELEVPTGSAYLFNADAQAVLEEAPDLETGLNLLQESYSSYPKWDNPESVSKTVADYAQQLRYRFKDNPKYSDDETIGFAPIDMSDIQSQYSSQEGESELDKLNNQIDEWEAKNKEFLETTSDPDYLIRKDKLIKNIEELASSSRRQLNSQNQQEVDAITPFGNIAISQDKFFRFAEGLTAGPAHAFGAEDYVRWLKEKTDPSRDDDLSSDLASGAGTISGIIGSSAVPGGPIGYLGVSGTGAVRERYQESLDATGDKERARNAALIEGGSQLIQAVPGERIFGKAGRQLLGREVPQAVENIASTLATKTLGAGIPQAAGNVVSNLARNEGTDSYNDPFTNTTRSFVVGSIFGLGAGAVDIWSSKRQFGEASKSDSSIEDPTVTEEPKTINIVGGVEEPKTESVAAVNTEGEYNPTNVPPLNPAEKQVLESDFVTEDNNKYSFADNGATQRTKVSDGTVYQPFDKTFFVTKENAQKLAVLRDTKTSDGSPVNILTDGENLYVKSEFVDNNLKVQEDPTGAHMVKVPVEEGASTGLHPVEVNRPRNSNGNLREYRSHIGREIKEVNPRIVKVNQPEGSSVGAAFTKERKLARKLYETEGMDPALKSLLGQGEGEDSYIYSRYFPITNIETTNAAQKWIAEHGVEAAVARLTETPSNINDPETVAIGANLIRMAKEGAALARNAGDDGAVSRLSELTDTFLENYLAKSTSTAQTLQSYNILRDLDPTLKVEYVRTKLVKSAAEETAKELNLPEKEIATVDPDLKAVNEEINTLEPKPAKEGETTPSRELTEGEAKRLNELKKRKTKLDSIKKKLEENKSDKLETFNKERQKLEQLFEAGTKATGSRQQDLFREAFKLQNRILTEETPSELSKGKKRIKALVKGGDTLFSYVQANALSSPVTQEKNIFGNLTRFLQEVATLNLTGLPLGKAEGLAFLREGVNGVLGPGLEAAKGELKGIQTFKPDFTKAETETGKIFNPGTQRAEPAIGPLKLVFRSLNAADAIFYHANERAWAAASLYDKFHREGLRGSELRDKVSNSLFNSKNEWEGAYEQAKKEADLVKDLGIKYSDNENRLRAWEILREKLPEDVQKESNRFAKRATFTEKPVGLPGVFASGANYIKNLEVDIRGKTFKPFRYLQMFVNVPANIMSSYIDFIPGLGAVNRAVNEFGFISPLEKRSFIGKQLIGTALSGTLYGLVQSGLDDKNPYFTVYGDGPEDYDLKKQLMAQGVKFRTIKIGNNYISWENTGLDFVVGALGAYADSYRWSPAYERKSGLDLVSFLTAKSLKSFTNNSFLQGLGTIIKAVEGDENIKYTDIVINTARNFIPASGALHEINRWVANPIETKDDLWAKFVSGVPLAQEFGTRKALNAFGDEIDGSFEQRVGAISSFYSDRVTDPDWRFLAESGYTLPDDRGTTTPLFKDKEKYPRISRERAQKYGDAFFNVLTPEERHEYVKESGPLVRKIVEKYRNQYGGAGYQEKIQERFSNEVAAVRRQTRQRLFLK